MGFGPDASGSAGQPRESQSRSGRSGGRGRTDHPRYDKLGTVPLIDLQDPKISRRSSISLDPSAMFGDGRGILFSPSFAFCHPHSVRDRSVTDRRNIEPQFPHGS